MIDEANTSVVLRGSVIPMLDEEGVIFAPITGVGKTMHWLTSDELRELANRMDEMEDRA